MMVQYCCGSGRTNKLFCRCFLLLQEANEVTGTWHSAQGDEAKTVELAPGGFDVK